MSSAGCAPLSAGVHAALVPEHLLESRQLGIALAVDALLLALMALVVRDPRHDGWAPATAAWLLGATAGAYLLSRNTGIPGWSRTARPSIPSGSSSAPLKWWPCSRPSG